MTHVLVKDRARRTGTNGPVTRAIPGGEPISVPAVLSPELALVDPDLAAVARLLLPDPSEVERTRQASTTLREAPPRRQASAEQKPERDPSTRTPTRRLQLAVLVATGLAVIAAGAFGFALATDHGASDATGAGSDASHAALQAQATRQARAARTYTWPAVPGAEAYELEIVRGTDAVFQATTKNVALVLPARLRLSPGRYIWSVTPTFKKGSAASSTRPVVEATFQVPSS